MPETERLLLRPFAESDIEPLYLIQSDPVAMRHTICVRSREESALRLRAYAGLQGSLGFAPWTVCRKADGEVIGWGGLNEDPFDPGWGVEVAYFFSPRYWGRGYATEMVRATLQEGFGRLGLRELHAFAKPENGASIRVLEKCGFRYLRFEEKIGRNHYCVQATTPQESG